MGNCSGGGLHPAHTNTHTHAHTQRRILKYQRTRASLSSGCGATIGCDSPLCPQSLHRTGTNFRCEIVRCVRVCVFAKIDDNRKALEGGSPPKCRRTRWVAGQSLKRGTNQNEKRGREQELMVLIPKHTSNRGASWLHFLCIPEESNKLCMA